MSDTQQRIDTLVKGNDVVLFMKGSKRIGQSREKFCRDIYPAEEVIGGVYVQHRRLLGMEIRCRFHYTKPAVAFFTCQVLPVIVPDVSFTEKTSCAIYRDRAFDPDICAVDEPCQKSAPGNAIDAHMSTINFRKRFKYRQTASCGGVVKKLFWSAWYINFISKIFWSRHHFFRVPFGIYCTGPIEAHCSVAFRDPFADGLLVTCLSAAMDVQYRWERAFASRACHTTVT